MITQLGWACYLNTATCIPWQYCRKPTAQWDGHWTTNKTEAKCMTSLCETEGKKPQCAKPDVQTHSPCPLLKQGLDHAVVKTQTHWDIHWDAYEYVYCWLLVRAFSSRFLIEDTTGKPIVCFVLFFSCTGKFRDFASVTCLLSGVEIKRVCVFYYTLYICICWLRFQ